MAKTATNNYNPLPWIRSHKVFTLLILIVALILGFVVYEKVALELNRRAFQQARIAIDTVYADVVKQVGEPDDYNNSYGCGGFQGELGEGPISCYLIKNFIYPVRDKDASDQLIIKVKSAIKTNNTNLISTDAPLSNPTITEIAPSDSAPITDYYRTRGGIGCKLIYEFDPSTTYLKLKNPTYKQLHVHMECLGSARGHYF